jgi:hypothetical protein
MSNDCRKIPRSTQEQQSTATPRGDIPGCVCFAVADDEVKLWDICIYGIMTRMCDMSSNSKSQIFIRCMAHPHLSCTIAFNHHNADQHSNILTTTTVEELKSHICSQLQVNIEAFPFTLYHGHSFLVDGKKALEEIGVRDGSIIDLVPSDVLAMLVPMDSSSIIRSPLIANSKQDNQSEYPENGEQGPSSSSSGAGIPYYVRTPMNAYHFLPNYHHAPLQPHANAHTHHIHNNDFFPVPIRSSAGTNITWPQILVLSIVPNLMIAGSIFLAIQFMKEFKTFEQLSHEGGDAMAQGFLDTLAKDDYKMCKEIVKKMLVGWMDQVNAWKRGWIPPYPLGTASSVASGTASAVGAVSPSTSSSFDYGSLFSGFNPANGIGK